MGILNLLKANFTGRVGQVVGAKWKNKSTIRSYTKPAYTNTPAQQMVRQGFGDITSFVALFSDQIKSLSALNTKGMSVRNSIIRLNKMMISDNSFSESGLLVSRGGLPNISVPTAVIPTQRDKITVTWDKVTGVTISDKAKVVFIAVNPLENFAIAGSALNMQETLVLDTTIPTGTLHCYFYLLDYRGSSRVASTSGYLAA